MDICAQDGEQVANNLENQEGNATFGKVFLFAHVDRWEWVQLKQTQSHLEINKPKIYILKKGV